MTTHAMTDLDPQVRFATQSDAAALADLINFAGEGLLLYLWQQMTTGDETAWDVGRRRARRTEGGFSYRNATILEGRDGVLATLIGYPLADEPEAVDLAELPPMFRPLQELEDLAPATWYVNVLAAYPDWRGLGLGSRLLAIAEALAANAGKQGLSIIVSDANHGARRLYERCGYRERAARPMVKEDWQNSGEKWVLLTRPL